MKQFITSDGTIFNVPATPTPYVVLGRGRTLYVDVDNTLIRPYHPARPPGAEVGYRVSIGGFEFEVIESSLNTLRRFAANQDTTIIVWSNGGAGWAAQVVDALGIAPLVTACLSKPSWFMDDEQNGGFMVPDRHIPVR